MNRIILKVIVLFSITLAFSSCKKENPEIIQGENPHPNVELIKGFWIEDSTQTLTSSDNGITISIVSTTLSVDTFEVTSNEFIFSGNVSYIYGWSDTNNDVFGMWGDTKVDSLTNEIFIWTPSYYMLDVNGNVVRHYCHKL